MNPIYRREVSRSPYSSKFYSRLRARRGGKIVLDQAQGYARRDTAAKEFDKIFSVEPLAGAHDYLGMALLEKTKAGKDSFIRIAMKTIEGIQRLIDRSEGK